MYYKRILNAEFACVWSGFGLRYVCLWSVFEWKKNKLRPCQDIEWNYQELESFKKLQGLNHQVFGIETLKGYESIELLRYILCFGLVSIL